MPSPSHCSLPPPFLPLTPPSGRNGVLQRAAVDVFHFQCNDLGVVNRIQVCSPRRKIHRKYDECARV